LPLGQVGGETVVVKTAAKETTASLAELTMDRFSEVPHATE
jgi:hypothetical protein